MYGDDQCRQLNANKPLILCSLFNKYLLTLSLKHFPHKHDPTCGTNSLFSQKAGGPSWSSWRGLEEEESEGEDSGVERGERGVK